MTWKGMTGDWHDAPVPRNECDLYHLVGPLPGHHPLRGTDAPTGPFSIIMACLVRYCRFRRVVELGVYKGGTTVFLADACRDTGGLCVAIDREPCHEARDRLEKLGLASPHCHFYQGHTHTVPYDGVPIDLLFIDAGHSFEEVSGDWRRWSAWVRPGGWVFIDNATSEPGVRAFLAELLAPALRENWQYAVCPESYGVAIFRKWR